MIKFNQIRLLAFILIVALGFTACDKQAVIEVDPTTNLQSSSNWSAHLSMTGAELSIQLQETYGHDDFSYEEKLEFLLQLTLDKLAVERGEAITISKESIQTKAGSSGVSEYLVQAQTFYRIDSNPANDVYETDVKTGVGLPAIRLQARSNQKRNEGSFVAWGANADIYEKAPGSTSFVSIDGAIDGFIPYYCTDNEDFVIYAWATIYNDGSTEPLVGSLCDD